MTLFSFTNIPVFWPILLVYFLVLFVLTMKRQIKHMIKHRYLPFTRGKPKPKGAAAGGKDSK
jgi:ABC-type amino acid transport system permease subunit